MACCDLIVKLFKFIFFDFSLVLCFLCLDFLQAHLKLNQSSHHISKHCQNDISNIFNVRKNLSKNILFLDNKGAQPSDIYMAVEWQLFLHREEKLFSTR